MSKKFHAEHRETGERWRSTTKHGKEFLVMYDSGYLAVVYTAPYECWLTPLDPKQWKVIRHD